ncbi:MAG TPA: alpha/beta fold hydrolase [Pirellulaceae bacterium]|nr:alpha/beta fold hydrolase [Pirellulaceae bacterium]
MAGNVACHPMFEGKAQSMKVDSTPTPFRRRWMKRFAKTALVLLIVWLIGDFTYSRWVAWSCAAWEAEMEWSANGVMAGCDAYSLGGGPSAVLFIHGLNENPYTWRKMAPMFAESGFHCRVMRLPGFGERTREYGAFSVADWKSAVEKEISDLRSSHRRVYVVAHSLGAAVLINLLLENPGLADGAVLLAPAIEVSNRRSPVGSVRFWHRLSHGLFFTRVVSSPFDNNAQDPEERAPIKRNVFTPRRVIGNLFCLVDANRGRAKELRLPLLIAVGSDDRIVEATAAEAFFQELSSEQKRWVVNDRAGHVLPFDFGWAELARDCIEFLQSIDSERDREHEGKSPGNLNSRSGRPAGLWICNRSRNVGCMEQVDRQDTLA